MNRVMRTGTVAAAIVGAVVAVALIIKEQLTGPAPTPAPADVKPTPPAAPPAPDAAKARKAPAAPARPKPATKAAKVVEDLSDINGIGPVYKTKLAEAGITSFAQLGRADASEVAEKIEAPVSRVQAWIDAARRRSA